MRAFLLLAILSTVICVSVSASAATWYVDGSVSSSGDGRSWETALKTIQEGIDKALDGDTVLVTEGTYVENIKFNGKNITLTSTDPFNPAVVANAIIDGNQAGSVVSFAVTETEACVLFGFTIRNGGADYGAGICGGEYEGAYTEATIRNNVITRNVVRFGGGGISYCDGTIQHNLVSYNLAGIGIGAISYCNGIIHNKLIISNSSGFVVGALGGCSGTIENNLICGNSAGQHDGGLSECRGVIRSNTIIYNSAFESGGGLSMCTGTIQNCIVWGNTAANGPQVSNSSLPVYSCIQDWTGGGQGNIAQNPRFVDPDGPDNDPATYEDNDYRLLPMSPCIDKGRNEDWMATAVDLEGNPRIWRGKDSWTVDMGAYEFGSWPFRILRVEKGAGGEAGLVWSSRAEDTYVVWSCPDLLAAQWTEEVRVSSSGETTAWTDPDTASTRKFYRIRIE